MQDSSQNGAKKEPKHKVFQSVATGISVLVIPLVLALVGHFFNTNLTEKELRSEYIKLGVSILNAKPDEANQNTRRWAVDLINYYSAVKIDDATKNELKTETSIPGYAFSSLRQAPEEGQVSYLFTWPGDGSGYVFELEKKEKGSWTDLTAMSSLYNEITYPIPTDVRLRWRAGPLNQETGEPEFSGWREFMVSRSF